MKDKKKIIAIVIAIVAVIAIIAGSTYAYWQITKTQETPNDIVAACLDLNLEDKSPAIDLDSAWPISDEEANSLTGYTFTVQNNCDQEVNYIVGLNRIEESNYLQDSSIKVRLDEKSSFTYGELSDIEYADPNNTYTSRVSKQVSLETIKANETNEHTIRVWVSSDAPVSEQSKIFKGQVFITGGQGIDLADNAKCFEIDNNGTILSYDYSCGTDVKVPAEINGIKVKTINENSFKTLHAIGIQTLKGGQQGLFVVYLDETNREVLDAAMLNYVCEELNVCGVPSVSYIAKILSEEEYNSHDWSQYDYTYNIEFTVDNETGELIDQSDDGLYQQVTSLDLSKAVFLENIEANSFDKSPLETLILPEENVINIGEFAFYKTNLKTLNFNKSLSNSGEGAFAGNTFDELIISDNNYMDTGNILYGDDGKNLYDFSLIKKLIIKSNITEIPEGEFYAAEIEEVVFEDTPKNPSQLVSIGKNAFARNNITNLTLPSSLETIGEYAFTYCHLEKIELPSSLTNLTYSTFSDNNITEVKIGNSKQANIRYFSDNPIKKIIISADITEIPENAFNYRSSSYYIYDLEEVVFEDTAKNPSQLKTIGANAFTGNSITNIILPSSLKTIGNFAFASNNLSELTIPSSVETIGEYAFSGHLSNLTFEDTTSNPSQLKTIGFYAFGGNELEGVIVLPGSITNLSNYVFGDNYDITTIVIKRTEEDALANISFSNNWNFIDDIGLFDVGTPTTGWAEVIYDPNYTE